MTLTPLDHVHYSTLCFHLKSPGDAAFEAWQASYNTAIAAAPGFISLEFLSPTARNPSWRMTQGFANAEALAAWRQSPICSQLMHSLKNDPSFEFVEELADNQIEPKGVTEVIITQVAPQCDQAFHRWSAKIHQVESKFPGFRGAYFQAPGVRQDGHWITLLQFDTLSHLDNWLESDERKALIEESKSLIHSVERHRVISSFGGWFSGMAKRGEVPAEWKQSMVVLLVLFPIVMLELRYLYPFLSDTNISLRTFIGNTISVALISFPMMPIAIYFLKRWLDPRQPISVSVVGTLIVLALYLVEVLFFWWLFS